MNDQSGSLTYNVTVTGTNVDAATITNNATQDIKITAAAGEKVNVSVVYATKDGAITFTRDLTIQF